MASSATTSLQCFPPCQNPPNFDQASLAIDALAALVNGLQGRLGENEPTLVQALGQLQQAFVGMKSAGPDEDA